MASHRLQQRGHQLSVAYAVVNADRLGFEELDANVYSEIHKRGQKGHECRASERRSSGLERCAACLRSFERAKSVMAAAGVQTYYRPFEGLKVGAGASYVLVKEALPWAERVIEARIEEIATICGVVVLDADGDPIPNRADRESIPSRKAILMRMESVRGDKTIWLLTNYRCRIPADHPMRVPISSLAILAACPGSWLLLQMLLEQEEQGLPPKALDVDPKLLKTISSNDWLRDL